MTTNIRKQLRDHVIKRLGALPSMHAPYETTGPRQRWLTMATGAVDRAGDILVMNGIETANFRKNPQFLWQHALSGESIHTIGRILELRVEDDTLYALAEYAEAEVSDLAERIFRMDSAGLLPANSIGFRPIEWEANRHGGNTFTRWEIIECSKVELPMNPEAVDMPARALPHATTIEATLDWLADSRSPIVTC